MTINVSDFLGLGIVAAGLSVALQALKNRFGAKPNALKAIVILGSVVLGAAYWFLQGTQILVAIFGILGIASTIFALVMNKTALETLFKPSSEQ